MITLFSAVLVAALAISGVLKKRKQPYSAPENE